MRTPITTAGHSPRGASWILHAGWLRHWFLGLMTSLLFSAPGLAWTAEFKSVPGAAEEGGGEDPDMILGLIHANTLFFIALGVFAVFWFLFGGGRRANIGRKGP